ncbi:MAG: HAD family phosphatase [Nanoarchaeota archaeon]|nr:HAD family phosphatase [Nanoarchaeota archaeon]MBU4086130.1 HAD family phosphatase [Nanoarchaeota archaeon]
MATRIKAIIFDIGGVVIKLRNGQIYTSLCKEFNLDYGEFAKIRKKYHKIVQTGKISFSKYTTFLSRDLKVDKNKFRRLWLTFTKAILKKEVVRTIIKLKKNYILCTLTNVISVNDTMRNKGNLLHSKFHFKFNSYECGFAKPDIRFYKMVLKKLKILAKEIVFIDDDAKNLVPARKLGMKTILFRDNYQLIKELKSFGVRV